VHELHVGVVPDLDGLIPRGGDADGGLGLVVESNARDGISVRVLVNGMFADTVDVPDFDLVIASTGENLVLVGRESNGEDISGVTMSLWMVFPDLRFQSLQVPSQDAERQWLPSPVRQISLMK
jgi:hypothetical protein